MLYYIDGKFINNKLAKIPFSDGGFLYGDGLFETMRFNNKNIFQINNHIDRLFKGMDIVGLQIQHSKDQIITLLYKVIKKNKLNDGIIRLMITRGNTDLSINSEIKSSIYISIKPFYDIPEKPVKVVYLDETNYPIIRFTPAIKSMNYIGNMLAKRDCEQQDGFEPIFYNKDKIITECAIRNIFYIKDNILYTPSLDLGILSGVMRSMIIEIGKFLDMKIIEGHIKYKDTNLMEEAFISSTGIGLLPCYWDGWSSSYNKTNLIKKELFNRIKNS
tara:strand:- start:54 stop:875 length:822 start_codon:yes stop_codon:yes gene_type:complete